MIPKSKFCVLIPSYNEENNVARVIEQARARGFEVIVVDDGSTDKTPSIIKNSGVQAIFSIANQGKGAAIRKGFDHILTSAYEAVIIMDADGQHDAAELDSFVATLNNENADLVIGNRMENPAGMPAIRRVTNRVMSWMVSRVAGQSIQDSQCGYRALKRDAIKKMTLRTDRYEIESEMLMEAGRKGLSLCSMPIQSVYRNEISRIRPLRDAGRFLKFYFWFIVLNK